MVVIPTIINDPAKLETRTVDNCAIYLADNSYPSLERRLFCSTHADVLVLLSVSKDDKFDWYFIVSRGLVKGWCCNNILVYNFKMCIIHHSLNVCSRITLCLVG